MQRKIRMVLLVCSIVLLSGTTIFAGLVPDRVILVTVKLVDSAPIIQRMLVQKGSADNIRVKSASSVEDSGYRLTIQNGDGGTLYETELTFPASMTIPPASPDGPEDHLPAVLPILTPATTVIVPYFSETDAILISDSKDSKTIAKKSMASAEQLSSPDFSSSPQPAPAEKGKFHLLIMASGYGSGTFGAFQAQADKIKSSILAVEPFKTQSEKMNLHTYSNTVDVGCYTGCYGIDRLLCCDQAKVISAATSSGYLFDEIIVVHNTGVYAGGGSRENLDAYKTNSYNSYCAVYDGDYSPAMAIHEFGHSFGNLCDEYSYGSEGYVYELCVNCLANCSPYPAGSACQLGCDAKLSYYRPDTSIMYDYDNPLYNDASILAEYSPDGLKKRLNYFTASVVQPVLSVTPASRSVSKESGTTAFTVSNTGSGTMPWTATVTTGGTWLSITSGASGTNAGTITCAYPANTGTTSRTGTIRVTASGATGSPRDVTVTQAGTTSAQVISLWPVNDAHAGSTSTLWAEVKNIGNSAFPSDIWVWYYVSGQNWTNYWVGYASMSGLSSGSTKWYSYNWPIPATATPGTYTYWARVYQGSIPLSDWSAAQSFTVGVNQKAVMTSPVNGSQLASTTQTFTWTSVSGATEYWLYLGSTPGGYDIYNSSTGTSTSRTATGLPSDGSMIYARLWTKYGAAWLYNDYRYKSHWQFIQYRLSEK
jgi:hypothetical protein